jgi:thioredoxin-related protein
LTRRIVTAALLPLLLSTTLSAGPWIRSVPAAKKDAVKNNRLIFVDLYAEWCGWCHRMEQEVFPSEVFQKATDDMVLLRLNTEDGADGSKMARDYEVTSLPTFLVLTPDLMIAGVIRGYAPPNDFTRNVTEVRNQYEQFAARVKQEPQLGSDYEKRLQLAAEFVARRGFVQSEPRLVKLLAEHGLPADIRDQAYYQLALAQMSQKKYDESLATIRKLESMQKMGESVERSHLLAGQIYVEKGNLKAALAEFKNFKTAFPNSPLNHNVDAILPRLELEASKAH